MSQISSSHHDNKTRDVWWRIHQTGEYLSMLETNNPDKLDFLKTIYNGLYSELRDTHSRQQQVVAWGFTILTGGGFLTLFLSSTLRIEGSVIFSFALALLTFTLTKTINFLSEDRMSIARQLDRIHQIMGAFTKDLYVEDTTLLDPIWYGWGFDKNHDVNWRLSRIYQIVLWCIFALDVLLLIDKAGVISIL
jgi:hypothetical protein